MELSTQEKQQLLRIARKAIESRVKGEEIREDESITDNLRENCGVFVTIHKAGALRGCIGYVEAIKPLHQAVVEMGQAAAVEDPRFSPVVPEELDQLDIEMSVLTPSREVGSIDEIEVGKHGIIVQKGVYKGLLLPQVATEYGWDRITFLEHTCLKAGLHKHDWKDRDTSIRTFSASVFGEKDFASDLD